MPLFIVPDSLRNTLYKQIDAAIEKVPEAAPERELFYEQLLSYFNENGVIPEFSLVPNSE